MRILMVLMQLLGGLCVWGQPSTILLDSFNNNDLNWYEEDTENRKISIREGQYCLKNKTGKSFWVNKELLNLDPNQEDFEVEVRLRQIAGSKGIGYGLLVALSKEKDQYKKFLINGGGQYKVDHYYAHKSHLFANYKACTVLQKGFEYNTLKVVKTANIVAYYINGHLIGRTGQNDYYGNQVAFFLGGKMTIEIDYIKVTKDASALDLVDNAHQIGERKKLSQEINSKYSELSPILSADGQTMYLCRNGHPSNIGGNDIWYATLDANGAWTSLKQMAAPLNNEGHNFVVSVAPDNNSLILANGYRKDGSPGSNGLSIAYRTAQGWTTPEPLVIENFYNKNKFVSYFLCADNKTLVMAVQRDDSYGSKDLYVSFKKGKHLWSTPLNMGNVVNTFENEVNPFIAADGKTLYFASQGHLGYGHHDIFVAKRLDDTWTNWSKPQNLGPKINTKQNDLSFYLDAKGMHAYLGLAGDIWMVENPEKPAPIVLIKGRVFNAKTKEPMSATIEYQDLVGNKKLGLAVSNVTTGAYQIVLPIGKKYGYQAKKEGFYAISNFIDLTEQQNYEEKTIDLYLVPIEKGETVRLNNLFFEFNKAVLQPESYQELDRLYELLKEQPSLKIEIAGHTDDKGAQMYNLELSQQRANAVKKYLLGKGVEAAQVTAVGYGEQKPLVSNSSEDNRAINRRVEFKVQ